jgi:hypothetical protein
MGLRTQEELRQYYEFTGNHYVSNDKTRESKKRKHKDNDLVASIKIFAYFSSLCLFTIPTVAVTIYLVFFRESR